MTLAHDVPGAAMMADGRIELRPGARLPVRLLVATDELHVGLMASEPAHALRIDVSAEVLAPTAVANLDGVPPWHAATPLPEPTDTLELSLPAGGCVTYVGYRGSADPLASMGRAAGW